MSIIQATDHAAGFAMRSEVAFLMTGLLRFPICTSYPPPSTR